MSDYLFSQFKANEFEALHKELSKVLNISHGHLEALYEVMLQEFELEGYPEHILPRNIFHSHDESFQQCYEEALVIGVDIPSVLEKSNNISNKKTVVIVGQDPLRKSEKKVEEKVEKISIGTPYALHLKNCREDLPNTRLYFDLIKVLLDAGYRVYLTDIFKVWVSEANCDRGIHLNKQDCTRFIQVLKAELEIFEPVAIVTWGKKASDGIKNIKLEVKHLEFPHPSGAANGTWGRLMGKSPTRENRINYWQEKVFAYLSGL
ncbi:MAG: uracil-DNA glycosylase family protein [Nostoc sp.]|uniref:uracil-DNA glycosylase family protein n=1 Tax=Nostoc sp. TaxID=1180 RepID=UPI002FFCDF97